MLFQRLLQKMESQAHFNTMCFSFFAGKTVAVDANQLQDRRKFLRAGDGDKKAENNGSFTLRSFSCCFFLAI